jgi:hypothetical protein
MSGGEHKTAASPHVGKAPDNLIPTGLASAHEVKGNWPGKHQKKPSQFHQKKINTLTS